LLRHWVEAGKLQRNLLLLGHRIKQPPNIFYMLSVLIEYANHETLVDDNSVYYKRRNKCKANDLMKCCLNLHLIASFGNFLIICETEFEILKLRSHTMKSLKYCKRASLFHGSCSSTGSGLIVLDAIQLISLFRQSCWRFSAILS